MVSSETLTKHTYVFDVGSVSWWEETGTVMVSITGSSFRLKELRELISVLTDTATAVNALYGAE